MNSAVIVSIVSNEHIFFWGEEAESLTFLSEPRVTTIITNLNCIHNSHDIIRNSIQRCCTMQNGETSEESQLVW